jgi:formiminotetrahydrofolate cyclodeaminase
VRDQTITEFLDQLASRAPAPGGGASAALHAAQAAALLGMVARYSDGPKHAEHADLIDRIRDDADAARDRALGLAAEDAAAFTAVIDAYRLPKGSDEEKAARSRAVADALAGAAAPPARVVREARRLVALAAELLPVANRTVITDVAAATEAARAAATTARINVEVNLGGITDEAVRAALTADVASVDDVVAGAERVTAAVREEIAR